MFRQIVGRFIHPAGPRMKNLSASPGRRKIRKILKCSGTGRSMRYGYQDFD
jgi:hypothetical protein